MKSFSFAGQKSTLCERFLAKFCRSGSAQEARGFIVNVVSIFINHLSEMQKGNDVEVAISFDFFCLLFGGCFGRHARLKWPTTSMVEVRSWTHTSTQTHTHRGLLIDIDFCRIHLMITWLWRWRRQIRHWSLWNYTIRIWCEKLERIWFQILLRNGDDLFGLSFLCDIYSVFFLNPDAWIRRFPLRIKQKKIDLVVMLYSGH